VCEAHEKIARLMSEWHIDAHAWLLLRILGADISSTELRLYARASLIQTAVGIFDQFDFKLSLPPYSLVILTESNVR
jgi:hypothetical protein